MLSEKVREDAKQVKQMLSRLADEHGGIVRGRDMIQGIEFDDKESASEISRAAFDRGLIIETSGPRDEVLKLLPPLTISPDSLDQGLSIIAESAEEVFSSSVA